LNDYGYVDYVTFSVRRKFAFLVHNYTKARDFVKDEHSFIVSKRTYRSFIFSKTMKTGVFGKNVPFPAPEIHPNGWIFEAETILPGL
jgi:hypothetical protein